MPPNPLRLGDLATARSGDKGNHANLGVVANNPESYAFLMQHLTAEVVHAYFNALGVSRTVRYELPSVQALNFVLYDALAGGASQSLRLDTQGKLLGTEAMEIPLPCSPADRERLQPTALHVKPQQE